MIFTKTIINWFSINKRELPWRQTKDPYHIWLSEIILQQTQVSQGLPYYIKFVHHFPSVSHLARANEGDVLKLWQGLGYYSRARNLHTTAKQVAFELQGNFPNNYNNLLKLKGIGDYTASAIASFCFNQPNAVVDGNVYRVLARYFGIDTPINSSQGIKEFKALAQTLIDIENPATYNQAIMEFGAIQCKPQNPDCNVCPLNTSCVAFNTNKILVLPVKLKAAKVKNKYFNFLVCVFNNDTTLLEQRKGKGIWENLYQFPLIETVELMSYKKFIANVKTHPIVKNRSFELILYNENPIVHKLSHQHLHTYFWILKVDDTSKNSIPISDINRYPVPVLIENFLKRFNFDVINTFNQKFY